ncbi:MAG: dTDP-4-dehydrorhamnose reductase [Planctomycetota bacterium]|jgi:dTDP-4-dehydrorhamnose reductase
MELATFADPTGPPVWGIGRQPELAPRFSDPRDGARWESLDLAAGGDLEAWLGKRQPEVVIHCAALSRVDACEQDPELAMLLNAAVPEAAARYCAGSGARYLYVSTDMVFSGPAPDAGLSEADRPDPISVYGRSKWEGEQRVLEACPEALVVRLPLLYGNSGGRSLGASDSLLNQIDQGLVPELFVDEFRTPLEVSNAADALLELADLDTAGVLHLAGPDRASRYDLGQCVLRAMGLPGDEAAACVRGVLREDGPAGLRDTRPQDVCLNADLARELLETKLLGLKPGAKRATS